MMEGVTVICYSLYFKIYAGIFLCVLLEASGSFASVIPHRGCTFSQLLPLT